MQDVWADLSSEWNQHLSKFAYAEEYHCIQFELESKKRTRLGDCAGDFRILGLGSMSNKAFFVSDHGKVDMRHPYVLVPQKKRTKLRWYCPDTRVAISIGLDPTKSLYVLRKYVNALPIKKEMTIIKKDGQKQMLLGQKPYGFDQMEVYQLQDVEINIGWVRRN